MSSRNSGISEGGIRLRSPSFRISKPKQLGKRPHKLTGYTSSFDDSAEDSAGDFNRGQTTLAQVFAGAVYGIVNSILTIPALYGYTAIIFRASDFKDQLDVLSRLVLLSSAVHQIVFTFKSSLPFSIGQVQDAGLIFLSTMASSLASGCKKENVIATTLVTLSLSTLLLGVVVYAIGRMRLATLVSYLPMPVIGGYLAFIGYFCLIAGIGLAIGEDISSFSDWNKLLHGDKILLCTPALIGGLALTIVSKIDLHWLALPLLIVSLPVIFYLVLLVSSTSLDSVRNDGWVAPLKEESFELNDVLKLFDFSKVEWQHVPKQFVTWLSMTFVVSFSSCLDVVAIEMDMCSELDINHELSTVGLSNIVSGLFGGYTGSYIFSQTIFTYRTGANSRLVGIVVAATEILLFLAPFNIMSYIPKYFFAATLIFIAFDLCIEWLIQVWHKVSFKEYCVLIGTFLVITITNDLILGIAAGFAFAIVNFIICYASVSHVEEAERRTSNVVREFDERKILSSCSRREISVIMLHGFLFFGSSVQIISKAKKLIYGRSEDSDVLQESILDRFVSVLVNLEQVFCCKRDEVEDTTTTPLLSAVSDQNYMTGLDGSRHSSEEPTSSFLLLDFSRVTGMDATAVSTGLMRVKQLGASHDSLRMVFTALRPEFEAILRANDVISDAPGDPCKIKVFKNINDGLAWIEDKILNYQSSVLDSYDVALVDLPDIPYAFVDDNTPHKVVKSISSIPSAEEQLKALFRRFYESLSSDMNKACEYFGLMRVEAGRLIFDIGYDPNMFYLVLDGEVGLFVPSTTSTGAEMFQSPSYYSEEKLTSCSLLQRCLHGSFFGETHFYLEEKREFAAVSTVETYLFYMTRSRWIDLQKEYPKAALGISTIMIKNLSLQMRTLQFYY